MHQELEDDLLQTEKQSLAQNYKFGVLYCKSGQTTEAGKIYTRWDPSDKLYTESFPEIYGNTESSESFMDFLEMLGDRIVLEGWHNFRGGLDVTSTIILVPCLYHCGSNTTTENSTGKHSYYTTFRNYEIMFHVNTLLPYFPADPQQLERKRHVGNDVALIVFCDGSNPIAISSFQSELNRKFFVSAMMTIMAIRMPC